MEGLRFSPGANRAHEIPWREWNAAAFAEAEHLDRPVLLNLTAVWCHWCRKMDETTYSDPAVIASISSKFIPVRVDADVFPHVQERYIAGGWPTNAILTPTGEVLWAGTYVSAEDLGGVLAAVEQAWSDRREQLRDEIARRRRAMEAARSRPVVLGLVRRETADDVMSALQDSFDARNGGFGEAPKFPNPEAIVPLLVLGARSGNRDWIEIAERTLDGMLAGELWDAAGGFFRYALESDWTSPRSEKLLDTQAGMLRAYAQGASVRDRSDWRARCEAIVEYVEHALALPEELWSASRIAAEPDAPSHAAGGADVQDLPPDRDPNIYTDRNAAWVRALADAGGWLRKDAWVEQADRTLRTLMESMRAEDDLFYHCRTREGGLRTRGLLADQVEVARACLAVSQATGAADLRERACAIAHALERNLWAADGGFYDHVPDPAVDVGALRYKDRPFAGNAAAARLLIDLALLTGERGFRAVAERTLALIAPLAGRFGVEGAEFALAVDEFFDPPPLVVVTGAGSGAAHLRAAALAARLADRRVLSLPVGGRIGNQQFTASDAATAEICRSGACVGRYADPDALEAALSRLH